MRKTKQLISKILLLTVLMTNTGIPVLASNLEVQSEPEATEVMELEKDQVEKSSPAPLEGLPVDEAEDVQLQEKIELETNAKAENELLVMDEALVAGDLIDVAITLSPEDSVLFLLDSSRQRIFKNSEGAYPLVVGDTYTYNLTKPGYVGVSNTFEVNEHKVALTLTKAEENLTIEKDLKSAWPNFRGNENNNAVVDSLIPTNADDASLYWATKVGKGWSDAPGSPIIVDDELVFTSGKNIRKMNRFTGELTDQIGLLAGSPNFNIIAPLYAEGMIFVGLNNGMIQAFDAKTLESLWVYNDVLKGQPNSPILFHDGYVYTGFWNNESKDANFVALSITDEDPSNPNEEKVATWTHKAAGGFYWSGSYISDDFLLIGTDDGQNGVTPTAKLLSLHPVTGELIDEITELNGDIRSAITYDEKSDGYYFTSKGGSFYGVSVDEEGEFIEEADGLSYKEVKLGEDPDKLPSSTSTPVISNGRAYVGVSGTAQFGAYSGHNITVIDLEAFDIAYQALTRGYPQTSGLLTTGYKDGYNYVYFIDNYTPGKIRVLKDKVGLTELLEPSTEAEKVSITNATPVLFTPKSPQAQYAIASPIADEYGTMYFKNDSGYLMALGSKIAKIDITKAPNKTLYGVGEEIDLDGMEVTAHYANGLTREITPDVKFTQRELDINEVDFAVTYDISLYGDEYDPINGNKSGILVNPAEAIQDITVLSTEQITQVREVKTSIEAIGDITLMSGALLEEARRLYDELDEDLKQYIGEVDQLEEKEEDFKNLTEVYNLIEALGVAPMKVYPLAKSSSVSPLEFEEAIKEARAKYDGLKEELKTEVTNRAKLFALEEQLAIEKDETAYTEQLIDAIGEVTLDSENAIKAARKAYDQLNDGQKARVKNNEVLTQAENTLKQQRAEVDAVNLLITRLSGKGIEDKALIETALEAYNNLSERQKQDVVGNEHLRASALKLTEDEEKITTANEKIQAIGEVTFAKEDQIKGARAYFNSLDENLKGYVTRLPELVKAEEELALMKKNVHEVTALIDSLKTNEGNVKVAREAYNKLTQDEKNQIKNLQILLDLEEKLKDQDKKEEKPVVKPVVKPGTTGGSPKTGDMGVSMWITLFILSGTFLSFLAVNDLRNKKQRR